MAPSATDLLVDKIQGDLRAGIAFLKTRVRERSREAGGIMRLALPLEMAVLSALARLELIGHAKDDVIFIMGLAEQVRAGADAETVSRANVDRLLRKSDLALFVRVKSPEFAAIESRVVEMTARRLPDMAHFGAVGEAADYNALVRAAFPERRTSEIIVDEQHAFADWLVAQARAHPDLVRLPRSWVPFLADLADDLVRWSRERTASDLDAIYGKR